MLCLCLLRASCQQAKVLLLQPSFVYEDSYRGRINMVRIPGMEIRAASLLQYNEKIIPIRSTLKRCTFTSYSAHCQRNFKLCKFTYDHISVFYYLYKAVLSQNSFL